MKNFFLFVGVFIIAAFVWSQINSAGTKVTAAEFGDKWPLTVDEGYVECRRGDSYVFTSNGKTYGLNGFGDTFFADAKLHDIWKKDPKHPGLGLYLSIDPLSKIAEGLC